MAGRRIAVVGGGQSGALLALALQRDGHRVTLATDRSADEVRTGPVMSSQCMFSSALTIEAELGLDGWSADVPAIHRMAITLDRSSSDEHAVHVVGTLEEPAQSIDQRLKCAHWIDEFARLGGHLALGEVDIPILESVADDHEVTIVASGKGQLADLFEVDPARSDVTAPQRISTMVYVTGLAPDRSGAELTMTAVPGVGECLTIPALTVDVHGDAAGRRECQIILIEAVPDGPLAPDLAPTTPDEHLAYVTDALREHFPAVAHRAGELALTDDNGVLHGSVTPTVRRPVATLPSGAHVLGMADVVVLNDPVTGQGSNNAVHAAHVYLQAITGHDDREFDITWMTRTFEKYWRGWGQWSVAWTNSMLDGIPPHVETVFAEATTLPPVADAVVRGFDDPRTVAGWWFRADEARRLVETARQETKCVFDPRDLRRALGQYATGVTVITALSPDGRKIGLTANSFTSVSMDPPLVSFCPARSAPSLADLTAAGRFAVNILAADQHDLSRQFATPSEDKFAGVEHRPGNGGTPLLDRVVARFQCRTVQRVDAGDHVIFLGEVEEYEASGGEPLVFHSGAYRLVATHPDYS